MRRRASIFRASEPDYSDFAYYSFVVGDVTGLDVAVISQPMRRSPTTPGC
jgi:uncharacterized membrane protein